jgi:hypothetical protein
MESPAKVFLWKATLLRILLVKLEAAAGKIALYHFCRFADLSIRKRVTLKAERRLIIASGQADCSMYIDFLYTILLLLALLIFALCYIAHREGCFSKRGWSYLAAFLLALLTLGVYVDYPAHFFTSQASATLQSQADSYLHLFDNMPSVPIRVINEPIAKNKNFAYFDPLRRVIFIRQEYINQGQGVKKTLKHEMVHAWMHWKGINWKHSKNHGATFQAKLREVLQEESD